VRILYCNKFDYQFSGTEAYLFDLIHRLDCSGHETALFSMNHGMNHSMNQSQKSAFVGRRYLIPYLNFKDPDAGFLKKVKMAGHALYSMSARRAMRECIADFSPDVAHIRGIYHHLSPSILWELKRQRVPVLYHVNDFKILCPSYNFVANGRACELCSHGTFRHVITKGCYTGPRSSALVLAAEAYLHKWLKTYERCVDIFLAPSEFVRRKLIDSGLPEKRVEVLPHFQELPADNRIVPDERYLLYFGRLSAEKGVSELLHAMVKLPNIQLIIAGDGPERPHLEKLARELELNRIQFVGTVHGETLEKLIAGCSFSIFPSHAYETLGKSILESFAWGRPVIASDVGSRRELVQHGTTGLLYADGDREQLSHSIAFLFDRPDLAVKMGMAGREQVKVKYSPREHLDKLLSLYDRLNSTQLTLPIKAPLLPPPIRFPEQQRTSIRVAFIGGRGVVSKYSGVESYYEQAGRELGRLGHEVTVYCRNYFTPAISSHNGMRVRRLPTVRSKHLETVLHTFLSTLHASFSNYDIVHYHCLGPSFFSFLPRLTGKKTVVTVQGLDWQRKKWGWFAARVLRLAESAAVSLPCATMVVSRTLQQYFRSRHNAETIFIPNGATPIKSAPPRRLVHWDFLPESYILFLGRFSPEKNCHLLVNAFQQLLAANSLPPGVKLILAGGSSHTDAYVSRLHAHESSEIRFLPWLSGHELDELMLNAALFVLPSEIEGMSLALLDAMAAGVCVLTSDIPENQEVVEGAGFTFRRGDQADLERMLEFLMCNPEVRRQSAEKATRRVQQEYQWPEIARSIEATYYEVLSRTRMERADPLSRLIHIQAPAPHFQAQVVQPAKSSDSNARR
jgi:glycosyltransferase involved in cell wall biosynthesis